VYTTSTDARVSTADRSYVRNESRDVGWRPVPPVTNDFGTYRRRKRRGKGPAGNYRTQSEAVTADSGSTGTPEKAHPNAQSHCKVL